MNMEALKNAVGGDKIVANAPLRTLTTFRCDSSAAILVEPSSIQRLLALIQCLNQEKRVWKKDWDVIGNGSNLLVRDGGYQGVLIHLAPSGFSDISLVETTQNGARLKVGAAVLNGKLLQWCREQGFGGFEFAFGIPGTIGGGIRMNAGTPQGWFSQVVRTVVSVSVRGTLEEVEVGEEDFTYRDYPACKEKIIVGCEMHLQKKDTREIESAIEAAKEKRKHQPLDMPNFGSVFKNPPGDHAARLIDAAGLKGRRVGEAEISARHANFIVNRGHAKTRDVLLLMQEAQQKVRGMSGVQLEPEVVVIGGTNGH